MDGWDAHRLLVMESLKRLEKSLDGIRENQEQIRREIVLLKVKSSLWGGLGGTISAAIAAIAIYLKS